ncbi:MAG: alpha-L-fucosidase [Deltaproteobacteria bacterium]|nr:alpha-L-fucosidase [Deltaproteobacteria bacterium]
MKKSQIINVLLAFLFPFTVAGYLSASNIPDESIVKQSGTLLEAILDMSPAKLLIQNMVRSIAVSSGINQEPIPNSDVLTAHSDNKPEIKQWILLYGESIIGLRSGPYPPSDGPEAEYVTFYKDNKIYLHVLDWKGNNNFMLEPSIIDAVITKATLMNEMGGEPIPLYIYPPLSAKLEQCDWGTQVVIPEDWQDNIDTIIAMEFDKDVDTWFKRPTEVEPEKTVLLRGATAELKGSLRFSNAGDSISGWKDLADTISWRIKAPAPDDYQLYLTYACAPGSEGSELEIAAGNSKVNFTTEAIRGWVGSWGNFKKMKLPGTLRLPAGSSTITIRAIKKAKPKGEIIRIHSLEMLSPMAVKNKIEADKRARKSRSSTDWLVESKYGVMFHWTTQSQPRRGAEKKFHDFWDSVDAFNVDAFADMVEETGAGYVIFTACHALQYFPAPIKTLEKILPGRTSQRDLIAEIADALEKRGIKLIVYYHQGYGDTPWLKAAGYYQSDKSEFYDNISNILTEVGLRYAKKVVGYWFDDRNPLQPFEQLYRATKAGNPDRIVAWNSWIYPRTTEFQEYYAGEFGGGLKLPETSFFQEGGPAAGLQGHGMIFLDDPWIHHLINQDIVAPRFSNKELIDYVKACISRDIIITMNMGIYQDGTVSEATLNQMRALRKAVRGK